MTYSESRAKYAETLNAVVDDHEEVVITRVGREPLVIASLEHYESLKDTVYLLRSPDNARRLLASIDRLEDGRGLHGRSLKEARLTQDRRVPKRITLLIKDVDGNGNDGIGQPEPLKPGFSGCWSRHITDEHRLIYKVSEDEIRIAACRYHFGM